MLPEVQTAILSALQQIQTNGVETFKTRERWQGDIQELMKTATKLPSAHVVMAVTDYADPQTIGAKAAPADMVWSVIVISQNLQSKAAGVDDVLALVDQVVDGLTRIKTSAGWLWPAQAKFLATENGKTAYGIHFTLRKE